MSVYRPWTLFGLCVCVCVCVRKGGRGTGHHVLYLHAVCIAVLAVGFEVLCHLSIAVQPSTRSHSPQATHKLTFPQSKTFCVMTAARCVSVFMNGTGLHSVTVFNKQLRQNMDAFQTSVSNLRKHIRMHIRMHI